MMHGVEFDTDKVTSTDEGIPNGPLPLAYWWRGDDSVKASSLIHGNGNRNFCDQVDVGMCSKWPASWKTPREGFDEDSSKFSLSYETKVINPVGGWIVTEGDAH
jgi:hypothetical protein